VDDVLAVAEQLHLDVPPALDVPLQVHPGIPNAASASALATATACSSSPGHARPQPAPPAAAGGLDENRVPDPSATTAAETAPAAAPPAVAFRAVPGAGAPGTSGKFGLLPRWG